MSDGQGLAAQGDPVAAQAERGHRHLDLEPGHRDGEQAHAGPGD